MQEESRQQPAQRVACRTKSTMPPMRTGPPMPGVTCQSRTSAALARSRRRLIRCGGSCSGPAVHLGRSDRAPNSRPPRSPLACTRARART
jgi:hypothetical protein